MTATVTYEMIPVVGYKTIYPKNRCIAVSYARLLLHDTSLKDINTDWGSRTPEFVNVVRV